jgi:hypothetical protein
MYILCHLKLRDKYICYYFDFIVSFRLLFRVANFWTFRVKLTRNLSRPGISFRAIRRVGSLFFIIYVIDDLLTIN